MRARELCLCLLMVVVLAGCTSARGMLVDAAPGASIAGASQEDVLVATSRTAVADPAVYFDQERASRLSLAEISVSIPPVHQPGAIELPPAPVAADPSKYFVAANRQTFDGDQAFLRKLNAQLDRRSPKEREVFIFVHGFNNNFAEAVYRTAQIRHDFDFAAVPVVYAWPSAAKATLYAYDRDSAIYGRDGLVSLLNLVARSSARRVFLIGHSMGGFLVMEALRQAAISGDTKVLKMLSQVVLASPDIDVDNFNAQFDALGDNRPPMVILVSSDDIALNLSQRLRGGHGRVGQSANREALAQKGIVVVDLSKVDEGDALHHTTFATSPSFIKLVKNGKISRTTVASANNRARVVEVTPESLVEDAASFVISVPVTIIKMPVNILTGQ